MLKSVRSVVQLRKFEFNGDKRRLAACGDLKDLRLLAKRNLPGGVFDYFDGAAEDEWSLANNSSAYSKFGLVPKVLRDVSQIDTATSIMGQPVPFPIALSPTGFTRMMHTDGEKAGASTAAAFGIPFTLSTMGTTSIEKVKEAAPNGSNWFQLYLWRDRDRSIELIKRAETAGYEGLVLTVDAQVAGARLRDIRNGLTVPPTLTLNTFLNALPRPGWWWNFLTKEPLNFAALESWNGTVAQLMDTMFDPSMTYDDLKWIRSIWKKKLIVKGVQRLDDALKCADYGVDAVVLSNHGGRQLDRAPVPFELLPEVRRELKSTMELHIDTGIMHGADIVAAKALGADFTWIGRAYLYGLMAGGKIGVERTLTILQTQMVRTLKLLGANSFAEVDASMIKFLK